MTDQITFKRLTPGQSVPRPPFRDAALVYDSDGTFKMIDGDSGEKKPLSDQIGGVIEANTTEPALRITQTGSGNALVVEDSAHPDATPLVVNNLGQIISGSTTAWNDGAGLQLTADSDEAPNSGIAMRRCTSAQNSAILSFFKSRGSSASPAVVSNGDNIGAITGAGYDGSGYTTGARIEIRAEGTPSASNVPSRIAFLNNSSGALSERMRIDSAGNVGIGTTANAAAILDVASTTKGFLPPRMTTTQRNNIAAPIPAGLMVYNTSTNKLNFYNGTAWEAVTSS